MKSEDQGAPCFSLSFLIILGMAKSFILAWTFMCPFFFIGLNVPSLFFQYITHAFIEENFGRDFYGARNIKEGRNEWMVWKCYPSGVEVLAYEGGVYVIFDHESMKRNSQRSQNLTNLKTTQATYNKMVSL